MPAYDERSSKRKRVVLAIASGNPSGNRVFFEKFSLRLEDGDPGYRFAQPGLRRWRR